MNINSIQQGKQRPQELSIYVFWIPSILPNFGFPLTVRCYNGWFVSFIDPCIYFLDRPCFE